MIEQNLQRKQRTFFISEENEVPAVREEVASLLRNLGYVQQDVFAVRVAAEEALVNAIKHGNKCDKTKKVAVACVLDPQKAEITVTDEGPGFDPTCVPDCTQGDSLCKPCGRGIALMRGFMDSIEYSGKGNSIRLIKFNSARHGKPATQEEPGG